MKIYLIDEQESRQREYGWNKEKFAQYDFLTIHSTSENIDWENLSSADIVLLHESFPDENLKQDLHKHNQENRKFDLVVFSGSKNERKQNENRIDVPVKVFYDHLEWFLKPILDGEKPNAHNLLYGKEPNIEKEILEEIVKRNHQEKENNIDAKSRCLLFSSENNSIERPFNKIDVAKLSNKNEGFSDSRFDKIIKEKLSENQYDNIYIPLCFGDFLSDFNGLRLAMHIRCTPTPNQLSTIFIYGVLPLDRLIDNPHFDILKTKNVFYIDYNKKSLQEAENKLVEVFSAEELSTEIKKINLEAPKDNHSIANEWAIYRWANYMKYDKVIDFISNDIAQKLYFKYYNIINNLVYIPEGKEYNFSKSAKILIIDDELDKGWKLFYESYFKNSPQIKLEFVNPKITTNYESELENKLKSFDPDIVLLDLRLSANDNNNDDTHQLSGYKLLNDIKEYNKGIQVIMITASNKIWNYKELDKKGANGYIIKRTKGSDINKDMKELKNTLDDCLKRIYTKTIFQSIKEITKIKNADNHHFMIESNKMLEIASKLILQDEMELAYFILFQIVEKYANDIFSDDAIEINGEKHFMINSEGIWKLKYHKDKENGDYFSIQEEQNDKTPTTLFKVSCVLAFLLNKSNKNLKDFGKLNKYRNSIAHNFKKEEEKQEYRRAIPEILSIIEELRTNF